MMNELEQTINNATADLVIVGTPIDLSRFLRINKPILRARYELEEVGQPKLEDLIQTPFRRTCEPDRLQPHHSPLTN